MSLLSRNADIVKVAPYDSCYAAAGSLGTGGTVNSEFIQLGHIYRIRQFGTITKIKIYIATKTNLTEVYYRIWRKAGTVYELVGTSENLISSVLAGQINEVTLSSPIPNVREGDFYSIRLVANPSSVGVLTPRTGQVNADIRYVLNSTPTAINYDWDSKTLISGSIIPVEAYMQAPHIIFLGDSLTSGIDHAAYLSYWVTLSRPFQSMPYYFSILTNFAAVYQNMGYSGNKSADLVSRFTADVVNLYPRYVAIMIGSADIAQGVSQATYIANVTTLLNAAVAANIIPIVMSIPPRTSFSTAQSQSRDSFNTALAALVATYGTAKYVNLDPVMGQFRAGGDAGNLWDLQTKYDIGDNTHFSAESNWAVAEQIVRSLKAEAYFLLTDFPAAADIRAGVECADGNITGLLIAELPSTDPGVANVLDGVDYVIDGVAKEGALKKYSVTTSASDTIRQQIMDVLDTRLKTILIANGYKTNIGTYVYQWKTDSAEQAKLPCILYRDVKAEKEDGIIGRFRWKLNVELSIATSGTTTAADLREMIQDILTCIGADYQFSGLALYTDQPDSNEINIEQSEKIIGDVKWTFSITYETDKWKN